MRNYRVQQIQSMPNVEVYPANRLGAEDVLAMEADHVVLATGARWLADGRGLYNKTAIENFGPEERIFTPDDIMRGRLPTGPTLVYDDDHYYMASVIAELLRLRDVSVTLVTPENYVSSWGGKTGEQARIQRRMIELGVDIVTAHGLVGYDGGEAQLECTYSGAIQKRPAEAVVTVTLRAPDDALYHEVEELLEDFDGPRPRSVTRIGDCLAPSIIAGAVYAGHRYARELDADVDPDHRMKHDRVFFDDV